MQLLRLEVKNWCQHKYRECVFTRGLVAIIGKIGSGKSNLLGAICWLLTGDNPNNGLKMENVSQLSTQDEPSYALLEFEHAGHTVVVTRHLLPEKEPATLLVDGVEAARGDKAVTAHIERLLGIDSKFISRFVIVAQNEIFAFIEDGASEVDKFFQKLFGTTYAEKCQDAINKHLNKITIPEVLEPVSVLKEQEQELATRIKNLSAKAQNMPTLRVFLNAQATQQKIIGDWQTRLKIAEELNTTDTKLTVCTGQIAELAQNCEKYSQDIAALNDALSGSTPATDNAKAALSNLAAHKQLAAARNAATARLHEIARIRATAIEPPTVADSAIADLVNSAAAVDLKLTELNRFVAVFDKDGITECPTCHNPVANLDEHVAAARNHIETLKAQSSAYQQELAQLHKNKTDRIIWEKQEAKLLAEIAQLEGSAVTFANFTAPEVDEVALLRLISDYDALIAAKSELEKLAQAEKEQRASCVGRLDNLKQRKLELVEQLSALSITQADAELAENTLNILSKECVERQELEKQLAQFEFDITNLRTRIQATIAAEQQASVMRQWVDTASAARDALKLAPRIVAKRNLQRLELAVNELLQIFGVDFLVKAAADDSPTFVAEFFDGRKQPAKRLSYGQKTVLALAFRVAVNALFAEQIGLLALDEPTAYLDQQRIKALAPVLERLRELSTARGLQCLLVTHETSLAHLFESTVELDA